MDYHRDDLEIPAPQEQENENEESWDGSEAELVADDDTALYEDPQTGIRFSYVLRRNEIYHCLKKTGYIKTTGMRAVVMTVLLALAVIVFAVSWMMQHSADSLVFAGISLVLIAVIWVVPELGLRSQARKLESGEEITMEIYPDAVQVTRGESEKEIPLDGESTSSVSYGNIIVLTYQGKMFIIPLRAIEPAVLPEVQAMLVSGTVPGD